MSATHAKFELRDLGSAGLVLRCQGGLSWEDRDLLAAQIEQHIQYRPGLTGVVFDLAGLEFINSAGLGALFQVNRRLRDHGARLAFASVPPMIVRMFRAVGLSRLCGMAETVEQAAAWLQEQQQADGAPGRAQTA